MSDKRIVRGQVRYWLPEYADEISEMAEKFGARGVSVSTPDGVFVWRKPTKKADRRG